MPLNPSKALPKTLPGVVRPQWVTCGRSNCRCRRGLLHGPYYYRFWREGGRLRKQYVKAVHLDRIRAACEARRKRRQELVATREDWRELVTIVKEAEKQCRN